MQLDDFRFENFRNIAWIAAGAVILWGLYSLSAVLTPFFLAAILAYIFQPVVALTVSVVGVLVLEALLLTLMLLTVLPLFVREGTQLARELPAFLNRMNETIAPWIRAKTGIAVMLDSDSVMDWVIATVQGTDGIGMRVIESLRSGGLGLMGVFATAVLVPVVQFYLMRDWRLFHSRCATSSPRPTPRWDSTCMDRYWSSW